MCIRDRHVGEGQRREHARENRQHQVDGDERLHARHPVHHDCLLYTSDAADERSSVDLGGRRIIKKKNNAEQEGVELQMEKKHR